MRSNITGALVLFLSFRASDNSQSVFLRFDDQAAIAETGAGVPDNGSTLALLGLSICGVVVLTRLRRLQCA
ncbi:MAG: hypothetical protein QOH39_1010 [Verrucomicrobiota bacterium]|jgi:hypothetical protein